MGESESGKQVRSDMAHDVFVSYSTEDSAVANEIVQAIEAAGLRSWIAGRDIPPAANWAGEIEQAIREARAMVLVVSPSFNRSVQTRKEVILGTDQKIRVLPVRVVDFQPWSHLRYFLADRQWVDASGTDSALRLKQVANALREYRERGWPPESSDDPQLPQPEGMQPAKALGILPPGSFLKLERPRPLRLMNEQPSRWLQAYNALVPMTGRESEIEELFQMLRGEGSFRWRVFFGEAGIGKTRLATEFAKKAISEGWQAGFLSGTDLQLFVSHNQVGGWRPCVPTLVIVDYAATKVGDLRRLFEHLAGMEAEAQEAAAGSGAPPVRVLLLERHADETRGWLHELLSAGEGVIGDLLSTVCFLGIRKLQPPGARTASGAAFDSTREIIENTFAGWAAIKGRQPPELPDFSEKDWRAIQLRTGNRPLYLQMAAIHACERNSALQLPTWGRGELLFSAVQRERHYVNKECRGDAALCKAVEQVTAILCLAGVGASRGGQWMEAVRHKLDSIGVKSIDPARVEQQRRDIFAEVQAGLNEAATGIIQPDIVSEGFAAQVLQGESGEAPIETLKQVLNLSGIKGWTNLVRMVQDLAGLESKLFRGGGKVSIDAWLPPLLGERPIEELSELINVIPERSISLHGFALTVNAHLLSRVPADRRAERAECLLSLGTHRVRIPNTTRANLEQAIRELQEAIGIFKELPLDGEGGGCRLKMAKAYRMVDTAYSCLNKYEEAVGNSAIAAHLASGESITCFATDEATLKTDAASLQTPTGLEAMLEFGNCLNNLGMNLHALRRNPEALAVELRAAEVGEQLAAYNFMRFAPDLARYLNNLSQTQSTVGDTAGAIANGRRSAEIRAEFARENPDEYAHPLSLTLGNLVAYEYTAKNVAGAEATIQQLIGVYDDLSALDPASYRQQLAQCYHNIGYLCDDRGSKAEGIHFTLEGLKIREELLESDFEGTALALAWSHHNVGNMYQETGELAKAQTHLERAYALRLQWVQGAPGRKLPELAKSASMMARLCQERRDSEAEAIWLERVVHDAQLSDSPLADRGMDAHSLAEALARLGRTNEAAEAAGLAAEGFRAEFAASSPEKDLTTWVNAGCNLASALALRGDWLGDTSLLTEAAALCEQILAEMSPGDAGLGYTWGAVMNNLGHARFRRGELLGEMDGIRRGLEDLRASVQFQLDHEFKSAAEETGLLVARAEKALEALESGKVGGVDAGPDSET